MTSDRVDQVIYNLEWGRYNCTKQDDVDLGQFGHAHPTDFDL